MKKIYLILGLIAVGVIFTACDSKSRVNSDSNTSVNGIFIEDNNESEDTPADDQNETNEQPPIDDRNETNTPSIYDKNETSKPPVDNTQPTLLMLSPKENAKEVSTLTNLIITLSENVVKGTGNILIKKSVDNSTVESISIKSTLVTISNKKVTINPSKILNFNTKYYVLIPNNALKDSSNNAYKGIADKTAWSFTTLAKSVVLNQSPTVAGVMGSQTVDDNQTITPFSNVTLNDEDGDILSATIDMDDEKRGSLSAMKIASASVAHVQAALRAVTFTPSKNHVAVGKTETTTLTLKISDGTKSLIKRITILVKSLNDVPTDITLSSSRVNLNKGVDAVVGTLSTTDSDRNESFIYSLVSGAGDKDNGNFNIDASVLRANDTSEMSAETYSVRIKTDDGNSNFSKEFNITIIDESTLEKIAITVMCTADDSNINNYIELVKGDVIIKDEDNTTINIYHDENNNKKVCLNFGKAHIEREQM